MKFLADLHIHSPYSNATSKLLCPEQIDFFARQKGVNLIGTGDFTHSLWLNELQEKLKLNKFGFYSLKPEYKIVSQNNTGNTISFIPSTEISCIYTNKNKVRKEIRATCVCE